MPTSGESDWSLSAGDVVTQAMIELGVLSSGEEPSDSEMHDGILRLNGMLRHWSGEANLWRESTATVIIPVGDGAVTLPGSVRNVNSVRSVPSVGTPRPLAVWNRDQFYSLPNRSQNGAPVACYIQQGIDGDQLTVWPVPAADITLHLDYSRTAETITAPNETMDMPQEWQEAVIYGLASRVANMFGATRLDPGAVQRVDGRGQALYQQLLDRDRPDSYYFETIDNPRGLYR